MIMGESAPNSYESRQAIEGPVIREGLKLTLEELRMSKDLYTDFRNKDDEALRVGLFAEDLEKVIASPNTTFLSQQTSEGSINLPLLVPTHELEWYNDDMIGRLYGEDTEVLYYAHSPLPEDQTSAHKVSDYIKTKIEDGAIILSDMYKNKQSLAALLLVENDPNIKGEIPMIGENEGRVDTFIGHLEFGQNNVQSAPSTYEIFMDEVEKGKLAINDQNGASVAESIGGSEAERLWEVYENPFEELGMNHPTLAGFDKDTFLEILSDPEIMKVVNKVDGKISTLCFFVNNFEHCPWFNSEYYQKNYPEFYETGNILMFPGIVTDENMRGENYAAQVIDLATYLLGKRNTDAIITFECTEISSQYIPKIVKTAVESTGIAKMKGLETPQNIIGYEALRAR